MGADLGGFFGATMPADLSAGQVAAKVYRINNPSEFKHLSNYMMANFSREMTSNKLKNIVGINTSNIISKWIGYLENAYVVFRIQRFSNKLKESIKAPKKIYALDMGMALTVYPRSINDRGRLMENLVAVELKRRIEYWHRDHSLYYWKNSNQDQVDFLLRKNNDTEALIQVTYVSNIEEVNERELKSLLKASEEQHCNNLNVITWDFSHTQTINGKSVRFVPLWIWLLDYEHVF